MSDVTPRVGQVWQDCDPRIELDRGCVRLVRVVRIVDNKATCEAWYDEAGAKSRTVRILLSRFRPSSSGYRFLRDDVEDGAA